MARGVNLSFLADVRPFLAGTADVEQALDHVGDSLDDLTADAARASDTAAGHLDDLARDGDQAADKLETSFRDAFDGVSRKADTMRDDVASSVTRAGDDGKARAGEAGAEIGSEFAANIGESIGSGQANIGDIVAGTLGGLVGVPGLGIAAAGLGIAGLFVKGILGGIEKGKEQMAAAVQTAFDAIEIDPTGLTIKWDKAKLLSGAIDSLTEGDATQDLAKVQEWVKAGVGEDTIAHALTGELTPQDMATLQAIVDQHTKIIVGRGAVVKSVQDEGKAAQDVLDIYRKQHDAVATANDLARISAGLTKTQADEQARINDLIRNRPPDPITSGRSRPGARWDD